jgi:hypothetical protein
VGHEWVNGGIVHMGQHHQLALPGQRHQFFSDGAPGVGAVVQVELAYAPVRTRRRSTRLLGQHHVVNALVAEPVRVVRPVAVQLHQRHDGNARIAHLRRGCQRQRPCVGP